MNPSEQIINVSEADFEFQVIAFSHHRPVLVEFWAEWSIPSRAVSPQIEKLFREARGVFRLARVNVDQNPNLALRYNIQAIPAVKAFRSGRMTDEISGQISETRLREWVSQAAPNGAGLLFEKGASLLALEQWEEAEKTFVSALELQPGEPAGLLGLARSLLAQGLPHEVLSLIHRFPSSREYSTIELLRPLAEALADYLESTDQVSGDLEAAYQNALRLTLRGNFPAAMDGLLDVLRLDKRYRKGEPRRVMVGLFAVLGDDHPLTRQYRQELASVLF